MEEEKFVYVRVIEAEVWSRVVGYFRPVQSWNLGKKLEFGDRAFHKSDEVFNARCLYVHDKDGAQSCACAVIPEEDTTTAVSSLWVHSKSGSAS